MCPGLFSSGSSQLQTPPPSPAPPPAPENVAESAAAGTEVRRRNRREQGRQRPSFSTPQIPQNNLSIPGSAGGNILG